MRPPFDLLFSVLWMGLAGWITLRAAAALWLAVRAGGHPDLPAWLRRTFSIQPLGLRYLAWVPLTLLMSVVFFTVLYYFLWFVVIMLASAFA